MEVEEVDELVGLGVIEVEEVDELVGPEVVEVREVEEFVGLEVIEVEEVNELVGLEVEEIVEVIEVDAVEVDVFEVVFNGDVVFCDDIVEEVDDVAGEVVVGHVSCWPCIMSSDPPWFSSYKCWPIDIMLKLVVQSEVTFGVPDLGSSHLPKKLFTVNDQIFV